jgi:hypothetical protein
MRVAAGFGTPGRRRCAKATAARARPMATGASQRSRRASAAGASEVEVAASSRRSGSWCCNQQKVRAPSAMNSRSASSRCSDGARGMPSSPAAASPSKLLRWTPWRSLSAAAAAMALSSGSWLWGKACVSGPTMSTAMGAGGQSDPARLRRRTAAQSLTWGLQQLANNRNGSHRTSRSLRVAHLYGHLQCRAKDGQRIHLSLQRLSDDWCLQARVLRADLRDLQAMGWLSFQGECTAPRSSCTKHS